MTSTLTLTPSQQRKKEYSEMTGADIARFALTEDQSAVLRAENIRRCQAFRAAREIAQWENSALSLFDIAQVA